MLCSKFWVMQQKTVRLIALELSQRLLPWTWFNTACPDLSGQMFTCWTKQMGQEGRKVVNLEQQIWNLPRTLIPLWAVLFTAWGWGVGGRGAMTINGAQGATQGSSLTMQFIVELTEKQETAHCVEIKKTDDLTLTIQALRVLTLHYKYWIKCTLRII